MRTAQRQVVIIQVAIPGNTYQSVRVGQADGATAAGLETAPSSGGSSGIRRGRRRGQSMQEYLDRRAEREVVLKAPPPAMCAFCSIDGRASKKM